MRFLFVLVTCNILYGYKGHKCEIMELKSSKLLYVAQYEHCVIREESCDWIAFVKILGLGNFSVCGMSSI